MSRQPRNDQERDPSHQQEGHREDKHDVSLEVERQQQASDHTNVQPGSAPASNEHGGRRLGETGGDKAGETGLG